MPPAYPPEFTPAGNVFNAPTDVAITSQTGDANIYYTTDGSEPTTGSTLYSTPITISENTTLKAIAEKNDYISTITNQYFEITTAAHIKNGDVSGTWTLAGSPYFITGNTNVPNGQTLIIEAGTIIKFAGTHTFEVNGNILANGTETDSIKFLSFYPDSTWRGFEFDTNTSDSTIFDYCVFQQSEAVAEEIGIESNGGVFYINETPKIRISNSYFTNNASFYGYGGAIYSSNSNIRIINNTFTKNYADVGACVALSCSDAYIYGNEMTQDAANYFGTGIYANSSYPEIINNNISNNRLMASTGRGGGIFLTACGGLVKGNNISYIHAPQGGCGMVVAQPDDIIIENNDIHHNWASDDGYSTPKITNPNDREFFIKRDEPISINTKGYGQGGGMYISGEGTGVVQNNKIHHNQSFTHAGGVYLETDVTFNSNYVAYNIAGYAEEVGYGGGIIFAGYNGIFANNTIIYNSSPYDGDALFFYGNSTPYIYNTVFAFNDGDNSFGSIFVDVATGAEPNFINCSMPYQEHEITVAIGQTYGGTLTNCTDFYPSIEQENEIITGIKNFSPLINNGNENTAGLNLPDEDIFGNPRINDGIIDLGCIEYPETFAFNTLKGEQTGTITAGDYYIQGDIEVPVGQTLTIEPGTNFYFSGNFGINNAGTLIAKGTQDEHITFTSADTLGFYSFSQYIYGGINHIHLQNSQNDTISYCDFSYAKVNNVLEYFSDEVIESMHGAFIYADNSSPVITNCMFEKSISHALGGAIANENAETEGGKIQNNIFKNLITIEFVFTEGIGGEGGAIYIKNSSPQIFGNLIYNNISTLSSGGHPKGGAILIANSESDILNNTIYGNFSWNGGGIFIREFDEITMKNNLNIYNNIVWNNITNDGSYGEQFFIMDETNKIYMLNNNIDGGYDDIYFPNGFNGIYTDNIDQDPQFENGYEISDNSPCKNTGFENMSGFDIPEFDIAGNQRIIDNIIDIGAYENQLVTSINDIENNHISIYPNPSNGIFTITNYELEITNIEIIDITGQTIKQYSIFNNQHSIINLEEQPAGIYFINIKTETGIYTEKLIIQFP